MKKDRTENIQKTYKKCAPYGNCTEIVQKIYKKCAKFCNSSLVETGSLFELLQILAHFLYIFCTISVQFPYGAHFLYVFCMFSVRFFFIGVVWNFFTEGSDQGDGHRSATCSACSTTWQQGKASVMERHILMECKKVTPE